MLSSNQINFMNIQNGYKIDSYFASKLDLPDPYSFRLEREFYLGGSLGDKLFEENTNNFIVDDTNSSYLTVNFSKNEQDTYKNFSFEIYDMSVNEEDIHGEISNIAAENTSIKIDGVSTPIKLFDLSKQVFDDTQRDGGGIDGTLPGAADGSEGSEPSIVYHSYIGTIIDGNYKYFLRFDGNLDINEISELSIINISSSTSTGIDQIVDLIKDIKFNDFIAL
jgi:hypothetical protein